MRAEVTLAELAGLLAVAQDHAFGQQPGSQLRATVLAQRISEATGAEPAERATTWWSSTLRFLGCTSHTAEMSALFGDEIGMRAESLLLDSAAPADMLRLTMRHAGSHQRGLERVRTALGVLVAGPKPAREGFRTACEVADVFAVRLGLDEAVRASLAANFERWNGKGLPAGVRGTAIPRPMRAAQVAQELEVLARHLGVAAALDTIGRRGGSAYDPALAELVVARGAEWWTEVEAVDPWDAALAVAPRGEPLDPDRLHEALLVVADFADLKSPWTAGHSRAVAALALEAGGRDAEAAALLHDLGRVAVPNSVWDKPGPLTRDERDRAEQHALVTDQLLRRLPATAGLADGAAAHERMDGSGYHRRVTGSRLDEHQRIVAAADCYQAMCSARPQRFAWDPEDAATELRALSARGQLDGEAVERVLAAAGHQRRARPTRPAGLSAREAEVLRLVALGLTNREVAERLGISSKTAGHHVQHIYTKLGVSTRGAATLFAIEQGILTVDG